MPFNLIPSPKSVLGLATCVRSLILRLVRGHSEEKSGTQLKQVIKRRTQSLWRLSTSQWFYRCITAFNLDDFSAPAWRSSWFIRSFQHHKQISGTDTHTGLHV